MSRTFAELHLPAITTSGDLADLFRLMCHYKTIAPTRYGDCEPLRNLFDFARVEEISRSLMTTDTLYWVGARKIASGSIDLRNGKGKQTASVSVWTDIDKFSNPQDLPDLIEKITGRFGAIYGFIHHISDAALEKAKCALEPGTRLPSTLMMTIPRWQLVLGVPNIYWGNIFGPDYITLFGGRKRLLSAPAPVVKEVAPDTFYIQLSDNLLDFATRFEEMAALQHEVIEYLGRECFVDPTVDYRHTYRVPGFAGWEEPRTQSPFREELLDKVRRRNAKQGGQRESKEDAK